VSFTDLEGAIIDKKYFYNNQYLDFDKDLMMSGMKF
jgi:hypothetical protein